MRVLHLLSSTGFHGAESMTAELVRQLERLGAEVDVGLFDNGGRADPELLHALAPVSGRAFVVPCRGQFDYATVGFLVDYARRNGVSVFHSHKYKTTFYALLARRRAGARVVATYHNWLTDTWPLRFYAALDKQLARFCDAAVGVSEPVAAELRRRVPAARVHRIPNGIDPAWFRRVAAREAAKGQLGLAGRRLIGFVGRLSAAKGLTYLLEAFRALPADIATQCDIVIAGEGEYRETLLEEARAAGLAQRLHLLGTRSDTPWIYSALDVFVLPSLVEAFPMVLLEAMACGTPVIGTDVGDVKRMLAEGSGLVVPPADPGALTDALIAVLSDPGRADILARSGQKRVTDSFSSAAMARAYLEVYREVAKRKAKKQAT